MKTYDTEIELRTTADTDIIDITSKVLEAVRKSGVKDGIVNVFTPGSTAAVSTIEYEDGVVQDLKRAIERLAPRGERYNHDSRWGDGNGYAHVRAALMKPSLTIPITNGVPILGTWQQVVLLDFDNRPRRRQVIIKVMGE
jgi:secondary thiamine-phosphate synthase enzyme